MFYFLSQGLLIYHWFLILAAVIPAIVLMIKVYRSDRIEKESPQLLWALMVGGVLSTLLALIEERVGDLVLSSLVDPESVLYQVILYFGIVGVAEETSKYIFLKKRSWNSPEFNCMYDGVVYAVFVSLGFALWENINYVLSYGFATALVRAVTAIPGHACFGVFMGVFYGVAKKYQNQGRTGLSKLFRVLSIIVPMLLHGAYDFIATMATGENDWYFLVFVAILFTASFITVSKTAKQDHYIA